MKKVIEASDAISAIESGMTVGIGGWGARRKPMALVRELCRSTVDNLTVVSYGGPDVGLLCASGKVKRLVFGFVSLDVIPLDPHFRRARQDGEIEVTELDEGMLYWSLYAAALRLPFLPIRAGLGTDVATVNPQLRTVTSPYDDGEVVMAMPPQDLDVALVHADQADISGNAQVLGPDPHFDELLCQVADRAYVSCERVVPTEQLTQDGCLHSLHLSRALVDGVIEAPYGAHPTSCVPSYGIDRTHLEHYVAAAKSEEARRAYLSRFVEVDADAYLAAIGGAARVSAIPTDVF